MQGITIRLPLYLYGDDWRQPYWVGFLPCESLRFTERKTERPPLRQQVALGKSTLSDPRIPVNRFLKQIRLPSTG